MRIRAGLALTLIALGGAPLLARAHRQAPSPEGPSGPAARAVAGVPAALAHPGVPLVAWLDDVTRPQRVRAARAGAAPAWLGPAWPGGDGVPAAAAAGDTAWVAAARGDGSGSRIWLQAGTAGAWDAPETAPEAGLWNHHPALAADAQGGLWLTWVAEDDTAAPPALWASRRGPDGWSVPERLPAPPGPPSAPEIVVDGDGRPVVAWSARDGADAEIWAAARDGGRWAGPIALTRNDVPDITPAAGAFDGRVVVTWARRGRGTDGYEVMARGGTTAGLVTAGRGAALAWETATVVGPAPAVHPRITTGPGGPLILWNGAADGQRVLLAAVGGDAGWSAPVSLTPTSPTRASLTPTSPTGTTPAPGTTAAAAPAARASQDPLLTWVDPSGVLRRARVRVEPEAAPRGAAAGNAGAGAAPTITLVDAAAVAPAPATAPAGPVVEGLQAGDDPGPRPAAAGGAPAAGGPLPPGPVRAPTALVSVPHLYTAFGDSITNGVLRAGEERLTTPGYRGPLESMLEGVLGDVTIFNQGVDGEVTADGMSRIDNAVRDDDPDVVLILEGANDVVLLVDTGTTADNLRRMAERVYEEKDDVLAILALVMPQNRPVEGFDGPFNRRIDEINAELPDAASDTGSVLVDMHAPFDGNSDLYSDSLHPDGDGYDVMAGVWFDGIEPVALGLTNRGDLDDSGRVDGLDLIRLARAFGSIQGGARYHRPADINQDGMVDGFDLAILASSFGRDPDAGNGGGS